MTDSDFKLFNEQERTFEEARTESDRDRLYDRPLTINPESPISTYLHMFTMPLDLPSMLMAVVMLILTYLTVHLVLILAAYLVWPITIAVFVLLLLPMLRDGTVQNAMPSVTNFFNNLSKKTSSIAINMSDYYAEISKSFSGRGDYFHRPQNERAE